MSISKSIVSCNLLSSLPIKPSHKSQSRSLHSSSKFSILKGQILFLSLNSSRRVLQKNDSRKRSFTVCNVVQPGAPPPSEPSFQFLNWVVGVVATIILPFFTHKWGSLLKIRNEVETVVDTIETVVETVEKVAGEVERVAEEVAEHLPESGNLRKVVDFVENVAETVHKDAHLVGDFIDKVQEAEEKVEECVESLVEEAHEHRKEHEANHHHKETNDDETQII